MTLSLMIKYSFGVADYPLNLGRKAVTAMEAICDYTGIIEVKGVAARASQAAA
jgi:hypothetical protein